MSNQVLLPSTKSPFSLYDFLGYFVPGSYLVCTLLFIKHNYSCSDDSFISYIKCEIFSSKDENSIFLGLISIIFLYIAGQIVSILSNIIIEELPYIRSVKNMFPIVLGQKGGYDLLLMSNLPINGKPEKGKIYLEKDNHKLKYCLCDSNEKIIRDILDVNIPTELNQELLYSKKSDILKKITKKGHIFVYYFYIKDEYFTGCKIFNLFLTYISYVKNIIFWLVPIWCPLCFFIMLFSPHYTKDNNKEGLSLFNNFFKIQSFSELPVSIALKKIENILKKQFGSKFYQDKLKYYFHYIYHFSLEKSGAHYSKINNYVALYGFMRNMLMSNIVLFYCTLFFLSSNESKFYFPLFFFLFLNVVFTFGYLKFIRRYTEEIILAACCIE